MYTYQSLFNKPDSISSIYSYEDCIQTTLWIDTGILECTGYAYFSVDVPPLTPPFSYNYDCSSVILTSYIPVYIYMYTLLALAPFASIMFISACKYEWIPTLIQVRMPGIMWPLHWSMKGSDEFNTTPDGTGSMRLRTMSDMSDVSSDEGSDAASVVSGQQPEPKLMINIAPIVALLMHNLYIMSTFGLCSPYLAIMVVFCVCSHIIMWKVVLGRFVICRLHLEAEVMRKRSGSIPPKINRNDIYSSKINLLLEEERANDAALRALGHQLSEARGIFAICIWPILLCSSFFFIFVSADMAGDRVGWTNGLWIPALFCVLPLSVCWIGMKLLMRKRSTSGGERKRPSVPDDLNTVELANVKNILHS